MDENEAKKESRKALFFCATSKFPLGNLEGSIFLRYFQIFVRKFERFLFLFLTERRKDIVSPESPIDLSICKRLDWFYQQQYMQIYEKYETY